MTIQKSALQSMVAYVVDDALSERPLSDLDFSQSPTLVGFDAGFESLYVAVVSCLPGCTVDADEACEIAIDLLLEKKWFADESETTPSIVLTRADYLPVFTGITL